MKLTRIPHPTLATTFISTLIAIIMMAPGARARTVANGAEPLDGERVVQLTERWRLGDASDVLLGVILDAVDDAAGHVYLADEQLGHIVEIGRTGEVERVISRPGEGPGELNWPRDLLWLPGGVLGVIDRRPGEVTRLGSDGLPLDSFLLTDDAGDPLRSAQILEAAFVKGDWVCQLAETEFADGERRNMINLALVDGRGRILRRVRGEQRGWDFMKREYIELREYLLGAGWWAVGPEGRVYLAPERNRYRIDVLSPAGDGELTITREFEPRPRTGAEREWIADSRSMNINGKRVRLDCEIERHDPVIADLLIADDGTIWARPSRERGDRDVGADVVWDTFDREGRYRERVRFAGVEARPQDRLFALSPERFLLLRNAETRLSAEVEEEAVLEAVLLEAE